ncbi:FAD-dependent oxidoreductase [Haloferula sp. A504]|uniref:FAD-dependent oxidoreductase n=1 Tax=Haloferula sp. A504 TaxID=3373601 RepID=UPI0031CBEECA|nr:FAD-dependent oxidoreductase [Verrucomicrobiaceae bacterium E54]
MIHEGPTTIRQLKTESPESDLVVVGGGLAGTCAAIAAAREGLRVVLVQDRPVLGGNASSEVRLWVLGATSHMGNNNRWSREGGIINEILEENVYRNRQGHPYILDTILLEKVVEEPNITLLLNTAVHEVEKSDPDTVSAVVAFCPQNSTRYVLRAPLFCDASGDGIVAFLAGAAFRMGAESADEFGEGFAPDEGYGHLLGHSLYFYTKDVGTPVRFTAPSWALKDVSGIARHRRFNTNMQGCNFWWLEYGGRLDTVHDTETIKWELWKVVYGIWDHIKNSGEHPEAENLILEWVGHIPGKRESRRFEGDYLMRQQDVIGQTPFEDVVAHGGWALDLHPADGVYSERAGCTQWHAKGVYGIPWRCYYSRNISNLFLAGRIISATHVAFGSTRVMATCAAGGQAVGTAAALCRERACLPREIAGDDALRELQQRLDRAGQFLPGIDPDDPDDLAPAATATASSQLRLGELPGNHAWLRLDSGWAMLLPLAEGPCPVFGFEISSEQHGALRVELRRARKAANFTPDELIEAIEVPFPEGETRIEARFRTPVTREGYHFVKLNEHPAIHVRLSDERRTGVLAVSNAYNKAVATSSMQTPPEETGIDSFEFWLPKRRPEGRNLAMTINPPLDVFGPANVTRGPARPTRTVNAWVADPADREPELVLTWPEPVQIGRVILEFDADWDHPMESVLMTHPEEVVPFLVRDFDLLDEAGDVVAAARDHRSARFDQPFPHPLTTRRLTLRVHATHGSPAAVFRIRVLP